MAAGPGLRARRIRHLQDFDTGQGEAINLDNVLDYDSGTDASGQRNPENPVPSFVRVGPLFWSVRYTPAIASRHARRIIGSAACTHANPSAMASFAR